jgi:uncharacterized BrkB/YihY/UPF0761 family membrane protein
MEAGSKIDPSQKVSEDLLKTMDLRIPQKLAIIGAVLITLSGVVNAWLGARIGALVYEIYPGGRMGHVGIIAGVAAILIGLAIAFIVVPRYRHSRRRRVFWAGLLTMVLGHLGAIAGALYVGTAGVVLCYVSGIWVGVAAVKSPGGRGESHRTDTT